jgi:hypothetical protein
VRRLQTCHPWQSPNASPGKKHRAAGQTDRRGHGTHAICVTEMEALLDQAIEIGRANLVVSQCVNRVPALVIRKNKQNVRPLILFRSDCRQRTEIAAHQKCGKQQRAQRSNESRIFQCSSRDSFVFVDVAGSSCFEMQSFGGPDGRLSCQASAILRKRTTRSGSLAA